MSHFKSLILLSFIGLAIAMTTLTTPTAQAQGSQRTQSLTLATAGKTTYTIVLASDAVESEKTAATELQKYLQQVTGATFPLQSEKETPSSKPQILVGAGPRVKALLTGQDWKGLGHDGIVIKSIGRNLVLAGGRQRGSLYAVYEFLEQAVGCRWWTPAESTIPQKATLQIGAQNTVYVPPFDYREHYTIDMMGSPEFAARMRENGHHQPQNAEWGGHYSILGFSHTLFVYLPPEKYFKDHPEWYTDSGNNNLPSNATSKPPLQETAQLCFTNPEVSAEFAKQVLEAIAAKPEAGYISVSQNDNTNYCNCPNCQKLLAEEGSMSGPLLNFVNAVAAKVGEKYPDFWVETLAYHSTQTPPKNIRPLSNVLVRLAPSDADFGHPLNSDWNKEVRKNLLGWSKISSALFVWNYVTNFVETTLPHPNWDGMGADLRFFAANKVKGVFEQGDQYTNGVGDFVQLRTWMLSKLMWNPSLDQDKVIDEFMKGYYGAAAPPLRAYIDTVQKAFRSKSRTLNKYSKDFSFLSLDVMNELTRLSDQAAMAVKDDPVLSDRVRRERLSLDYAWLYRYKILQRAKLAQNGEWLGPTDPGQAMQEYIRTAQRFKISQIRMGTYFGNEIPKLEKMFTGAVVELPDFAKEFPPGDVIDMQQDSYALYDPLAKSIDDPKASDGKTAIMTGDTIQWAVQIFMGPLMDDAEKWHVYAMAKVKPKAGADAQGPTFEFGVYNFSQNSYVSRRTINLDQVANGDEFQKLDLGVYTLDGGMQFWYVPAVNSAAEQIYIDRMILIREK